MTGVLVLGGGSDIAAASVAAIAETRAATPLRVLAAAREPDAAVAALESALAAAGPAVTVMGHRWDALDVAGHEAEIAAMVTELGTVDVVICAVGRLGHHAGLSMGPTEVDLMVRSNFAGPAAALAAVAPHLQRQGRGTIVVFSSVAGARARRSNYVYGSSKSGLDAFAQGMGDALAGTGVDVIVVRPGFVRSKMTVGLEPAPFSRTPEEVGAAVARAVARGGSTTVWVPSILGPMMAVLRNAPRAVWRRVAGDR